MLKFKDFTVPLLPDDTLSEITGYTKKNYTVRVFYDDAWADGKRNAIVFLSGGTGLNVQTETSARPIHTVSQGLLHIDTMSVPENYVFYRNAVFPNSDFKGASLEVAAYLKVIEKLDTDADIGKYFKADSTYAMLGHSRGATLVMEWATAYMSGNPKFSLSNISRLKALVINSPMGSGVGGYSGYDRFLRFGAKDINSYSLPKLKYTVGEGDKTHTSRPMMERLYRFGMLQNKNIEFQVVGDATYTHDYPTTTEQNQYKTFLNFGIDALK